MNQSSRSGGVPGHVVVFEVGERKTMVRMLFLGIV